MQVETAILREETAKIQEETAILRVQNKVLDALLKNIRKRKVNE
jgi:hypothetical protein